MSLLFDDVTAGREAGVDVDETGDFGFELEDTAETVDDCTDDDDDDDDGDEFFTELLVGVEHDDDDELGKTFGFGTDGVLILSAAATVVFGSA